MFGAIYTGMSGLSAYSNGLDTISNNIANLNTPGFKGNDLLFQDLFYGYQMNGDFNNNYTTINVGNGAVANSSSIIFSQGDVRTTGNDTDVAIDGHGFFILRDGSEAVFTRSGQFQFDSDGYLVTRDGKYRVAALDESNELVDINISGLKTNPPQSTGTVSFVNNLSTGTTRHEIDDVSVYDSAGNQHNLTVTLINNNSATPRSWLVEVQDVDGNVVATAGEIRFQGNGSPEIGFNNFTFTFSPDAGDPMDLTLDFGDPGSFTGATSFSGGTSSELSVDSTDGNKFGSLTSVNFTEDGVFTMSYSNGEVVDRSTLALAYFDNPQSLKLLGGSLFSDPDGEIQISSANNGGLGEIVGKSIELSNVELTQQFTDLIIVQRGYQASSQILTVANEMLQQLLDSVGGR